MICQLRASLISRDLDRAVSGSYLRTISAPVLSKVKQSNVQKLNKKYYVTASIFAQVNTKVTRVSERANVECKEVSGNCHESLGLLFEGKSDLKLSNGPKIRLKVV